MIYKKYVNFDFSIFEEHFDFAYGTLYDYPVTGIEEKFDELIVTMELDNWSDELREKLISEISSFCPEFKILNEEIIEDRNWNEEYEKNVPVIIISDRIGIAPEWKQAELTNEIKIIINPKMSFGTGEHATTKMMCQLLEKYVEKGSNWIDAGCGTGLLSVLAIKLGAKSVFAFDYDEWSIENSKENTILNGVNDKIEIMKEKIENISLPPSDGIAANLFSNLLLVSLPKFRESLLNGGGNLIVSGILKYDKEQIIEEAKKNGFYLNQELFDDEWIAMHFTLLGNK
jgi:ribosomal protein L11 methyltransferase